MIKTELSSTAAKLAGGAVTYVTSYTVVEKSTEATMPINPVYEPFNMAYASDLASLVAGILTGLYFAVQLGYSIWTWRKDIKNEKAKNETPK